MAAMPQADTPMNDAELIQDLIPINTLRPDTLPRLLAHARFEDLPAGMTIFSAGDKDTETVYVIEGEVTLVPRAGMRRTVAGGTDDARYALAQLKPRQLSGITKTAAKIVRIESESLDSLLTMEQTCGYEVAEMSAGEGEWVYRMMRHPALEKILGGNLAALFERLTPIEAKAGQVLVRQGDPGDYYYIIKSGRASVTRKLEQEGKVQMLAELREGDAFGEEALVSSTPRNATVIALAPTSLMRLAQADFVELLRAPLVQQVSLAEAQEMAKSGAGLIDVRTEEEFQQGAIKGAINLPLYGLRRGAKSLDTQRPYVICCDSGKRSSAAAFLLSQRGFDACVLEGGLNAITAPA